MSKKLTQEEVIKQFREVHGDKYDYSKVKYVNKKTKVEIICPIHGSFYQIPNNHKRGATCSYCSGQKTHINDSIGMKRPDLIKYFIDRDDAFKYAPQSNKKVKLRCPDCGFEKYIRLQKLSNQGFYCDNCNSFENNYPKLMKYLVNKEDGKLSRQSARKIKLKCPNCEFEKNMRLDNLSNEGFSCPKCSDGISIPEKFMNNLLSDLNVNFQTQYNSEWSENKRYDFYIDDLKMIIETHGIQHYEQSNRGRSLQEEKENDRIKKDLALNNGIENYIVVDCRKSTLKWLKGSCIKELSLYFDLSNVDWSNIWSKCRNSLVKEVCEAWNNKRGDETTKDIARKFNLGRNTVTAYLKRGNELGWCEYNTKEEKIKKNSKKVCQYTKNGNFIKEYPSQSEASKQTKTRASSISDCCRGKLNTAGGYIWKYAE